MLDLVGFTNFEIFLASLHCNFAVTLACFAIVIGLDVYVTHGGTGGLMFAFLLDWESRYEIVVVTIRFLRCETDYSLS
jgi:hypothetical protein